MSDIAAGLFSGKVVVAGPQWTAEREMCRWPLLLRVSGYGYGFLLQVELGEGQKGMALRQNNEDISRAQKVRVGAHKL